MEKVIHRVQEQLENNWAVEKCDIQLLLMFAICYWRKVSE